MCGIAGTINLNINEKIVFNSLNHRGPDDHSYIKYSNVTLFHTRLSIQDIVHGQQPFSFKDLTIVFNGEVYNHAELREKYLQEYIFLTISDTETLLLMYDKFREKMFQYIDGMFAFCILDKKNNQIILSRDRSGKKPLYLYHDKKTVLFTSEMSTIKSSINSLEIDEDAIASYLRNGLFFSQNTSYKDVITLKAGIIYKINIDSLEVSKSRYFNILDFYEKSSKLNFKEALLEIDRILHKSIKDRLESSDLEVGAFLSGGIDSSLIVAIASEYKNNLKTFTVKFSDGYDESHLARLTANKYNTKHTELSISMNLKEDIEKILLNYGQPFMDSSAIPSYYVSKEAKKHVTVILNGDGADELFGGYRRYVPPANGLLTLANKISFLINILPKPHNKKSMYNYIYRLLSMSSKNGLNFYNSSTIDIFEDEYIFEENKINNEMEKFINSVNLDPLSKMLYLDFNILLFSNLLIKMDIATMSQSLEGRSPFLSKYLLEFVPTLNNNFKVKGKNTKYILRELAKKYLPNDLINQPKRGFEVPLKKWVNNDLKENIFDSLNHNSYSSIFVDKKFIENLLNKKIDVSEEKRAKMLWTMYSLEVWKRKQ